MPDRLVPPAPRSVGVRVTVVLAASLLAACVLAAAGCSTTVTHVGALPLPVAGVDRMPSSSPGATPSPTATATPSGTPTSPTRRPAPRTTPKPTLKKSTSTSSGIEVWDVAPGGTGVIGAGSKGLIRYRVEVERATGLNAATVAATVDATLAGRRGWTVDGWQFQRSTLPNSGVDMVVRVATPATVDKICSQYGLLTGGVVSCRGGKFVMINLARWNVGIPAYSGHVDQYRALVVNHEVGHRIGLGHAACPGAGLPAPVMMQQYYGLDGCLPNVWPFTADGTRIG